MMEEEFENGRDDMIIDGREPEAPEQKQGSAVPDEFNTNYLKIYYGKFRFLSDCSFDSL